MPERGRDGAEQQRMPQPQKPGRRSHRIMEVPSGDWQGMGAEKGWSTGDSEEVEEEEEGKPQPWTAMTATAAA